MTCSLRCSSAPLVLVAVAAVAGGWLLARASSPQPREPALSLQGAAALAGVARPAAPGSTAGCATRSPRCARRCPGPAAGASRRPSWPSSRGPPTSWRPTPPRSTAICSWPPACGARHGAALPGSPGGPGRRRRAHGGSHRGRGHGGRLRSARRPGRRPKPSPSSTSSSTLWRRLVTSWPGSRPAWASPRPQAASSGQPRQLPAPVASGTSTGEHHGAGRIDGQHRHPPVLAAGQPRWPVPPRRRRGLAIVGPRPGQPPAPRPGLERRGQRGLGGGCRLEADVLVQAVLASRLRSAPTSPAAERGHEQRGPGDVEDGVVERHRRGQLGPRLPGRGGRRGTHTTTAGSTASGTRTAAPAGRGHHAPEQRRGDVVGVTLQLGAPGQHVGRDRRPGRRTGRRRPPPRRGRARGRPRAPHPEKPRPRPIGMDERTQMPPAPPRRGTPARRDGWSSAASQPVAHGRPTSPASRCRVSASPRASKPGPRLADDAGTRTITAGIRGLPPPPARRPPAARRPRRPARRRAPASARATPASRPVAAAADHQAGGRVEDHHVAVRPPLAGQHGPGQAGVRRRLAASQLLGRGPGQPEGGGVDGGAPHDVAVELPHRRRRRRGELVESVVAVHHQHPRGAVVAEHPEHALGHGRVGHPDDQAPHSGRVRHRAEHVERGGDAQLAARSGRRGAAPGGSGERSRTPCPPPRGTRPRPAGASSRSTPRASSRSAEPQLDEAARLPCLHTGTPAPATTKLASVETLIVWLRSPPVPTMSTAWSRRPAGSGTSSAASSMAASRPVSSSTDSPFIRRATTKPASWAGVAAPSRISASAAWACSAVRSWPATSGPSTAGHPPRSASVGTPPSAPASRHHGAWHRRGGHRLRPSGGAGG